MRRPRRRDDCPFFGFKSQRVGECRWWEVCAPREQLVLVVPDLRRADWRLASHEDQRIVIGKAHSLVWRQEPPLHLLLRDVLLVEHQVEAVPAERPLLHVNGHVAGHATQQVGRLRFVRRKGDTDVTVAGDGLLAAVDAVVLREVLRDEKRADAVAGEPLSPERTAPDW